MTRPEHLHGHQPDDQPKEAEVEQPEVAREARDMTEAIMRSAKQNPRFLTELAENYFDGYEGYVTYEDEDGNALNHLKFEKRTLDIDANDVAEVYKSTQYRKSRKLPDGKYEYASESIMLGSVYRGDQPERGSIWSIKSPDKRNTASVIREVRQVVAENFPEPQAQAQTPTQK